MKKEDIFYTGTSESISYMINKINIIEGDTVIGFLSCERKVVYVDYIRKMVVIASTAGIIDVLSFDDISDNFHKVVEDTQYKNITSKDDIITIASGYEIEDSQGNKAKVCYIDYVSRIVVIVQDGKGHNLFFNEICRDWFRVLEESGNEV